LTTLSAGKLWGLRRLADERGLFRMLAVDQRPPITNGLRALSGAKPAIGMCAPWGNSPIAELASRHRHPIFAPDGPKLASAGHDFPERYPEME
jgi:hypothetical protein